MKIDDLTDTLKRPSSLICGVAATMADKFAWSCLWTRVVWTVAVVMNPAMFLVIYFALALVLPRRKSPY
ncbi:PspC domain-containing protein [Shewanella algidipiscicola]|uniref:PspC domain-containing protein n=1 Tax=Shewanella algidipiscicola TaxID=614070 RepID=A0ABQ4PCW8_9GAMM|nr:PspC domain-containing protein [Shewanella algidipiscicola]GIU45336.1 PspC domain-containing protein [Shewanella algidipiscicola]